MKVVIPNGEDSATTRLIAGRYGSGIAASAN
jgi:hypothetical protein